jgi:acyl-CoA reductase-like NAD-dependent aldehyde dehydrogenase
VAAAHDAATEAPGAAHPPRERSKILRRAFERIGERREELALRATRRSGYCQHSGDCARTAINVQDWIRR